LKVGDIVKLSQGPVNYFNLKSFTGILIKKLPRKDRLEYDWLVLADGRFIELGRQIEQSSEVINE